MDLVKSDLVSRCSDINVFYNHIVEVSNLKGTVKISAILKASLFIALYNNVEATFYSIFEDIHNNLNKVKYDDLSDKLKMKLKLFYFNDKDVEDEECRELRFPLLKDLFKKSNLFSGNLDARKGKALFRTYGISFDKKFELRKLHSLVTIKNKRNKIAHGELSLPEAGKIISHQNLLSVINSSTEVLDEFINSAEVFLLADGHLSQK